MGLALKWLFNILENRHTSNMKLQKFGNFEYAYTTRAIIRLVALLCQYLYQGRTSNVPVYSRCYSKLRCVHIIYIMFSSLILIMSLG